MGSVPLLYGDKFCKSPTPALPCTRTEARERGGPGAAAWCQTRGVIGRSAPPRSGPRTPYSTRSALTCSCRQGSAVARLAPQDTSRGPEGKARRSHPRRATSASPSTGRGDSARSRPTRSGSHSDTWDRPVRGAHAGALPQKGQISRCATGDARVHLAHQEQNRGIWGIRVIWGILGSLGVQAQNVRFLQYRPVYPCSPCSTLFPLFP